MVYMRISAVGSSASWVNVSRCEFKSSYVLLCLQEESSDKVQVEGVNTELRSQVATLKKERMELSEQLQNKINCLGKISVRNVSKESK